MSKPKTFRWMSFPGLLVLLVGCAIISGDSDDDGKPAETFVVKAETLNVRARPSITAAVIAHAPRGTVIVPTDQAGEWYGVEMEDGGQGWVHADFLKPAR